MKIKNEYLYAAISILMWSTTATITKLLLGNLTTTQIMLVGYFFAFIFLLIVNLIKGNLKELKEFKATDYLQIGAIGSLGTFFYHKFLYIGMDILDASQALIINELWPIMIVIFSCIILKEQLTVKKVFAIVLSFAGVIIVASDKSILSMGAESAKGVICCILAAVSYGLFSVLCKLKTYNRLLSTMIFYFVSTVISLLYVALFEGSFELSAIQTWGLMWSGVFTNAIAFTTWTLALEKGDTAKVSNLCYLVPVISLVWTSLILKEELKITTLVGLVVIIAGILIQIKKDSPKIKNIKQTEVKI